MRWGKLGSLVVGASAVLGCAVSVRAMAKSPAVSDSLPVPALEHAQASYEYIHGGGALCPVMHACGHHFHMASWLGVAEVRSAKKSDWKGTLVLLAQPAEETLIGRMKSGGEAPPSLHSARYRPAPGTLAQAMRLEWFVAWTVFGKSALSL